MVFGRTTDWGIVNLINSQVMNQKPNNAPYRLLAGLAALTLGTVVAQAQAVPPVLAHWDFERLDADGVSIKSVDGKYVGAINDAAKLTEAGGGRPGGGRGFDVSQANSSRGYILVEATGDDNPMNLAAADDVVTIMLWQKNFSNVNSSSFWFVADSQARGIQAHLPWSNGQIYLDSNGCCAAPSQRLNQAPAEGFDWNTWHHYALVKNKEAKQIYVDGELLAEQTEGVGPLPTDFTQLFIGAASDRNAPDGIIDDFAIFKGALTQRQIQDIAKGAPIGTPPVDTDKDGMPDTWEVDYGFNPNSAADAALDALGKETGSDEPVDEAPIDFSQQSPGNTDLTVLEARFRAVEAAAQGVIFLPHLRQLLQGRDALEAAKSAEDAEGVGRVLTWAENLLGITTAP